MVLTQYSCSKCGEAYKVFPPDNIHRKISRYPDRNTVSTQIKCNICGSEFKVYWKS